MSEKRLSDGAVIRKFAIGQLGWAILSGIISNWLVYYYMPSDTLVSQGMTVFITQGIVSAGLTVIGIITACGRLLDMLQYHELRHKPGVRPLDQAVAGATVRKIGVEGAFGWNKLGSDVDISPLVAATLALHGAVTSTRRPGDEPEQRMIELP